MDLTSIEPLLAWLRAHSQWLELVLFLTAFAESLALVGLVLPGVVMLFGIALLAATGGISLEMVLIWGYLGAIAGDNLSYFLGRYCHGPLSRTQLFRDNPQWIDKGEAFFNRHGILSVVVGRFIGPLRPIIPMVAGMMEMPAHRFVTVSLISGLGWAPVYLLPGFLAGAAASGQTIESLQWFYQLFEYF
ncbi:DedA family protein [Aestuariirhabdus sp. Z084]|uniref:DedA family protein n=1 Tax=Aestuariirhabdus haliotis TaxID=2918751 RepID=UPI00201B4434|nr:DedA family protein [Aestuariirhabdus haliotis]MCL6416701.1 DedA family protein [Aestuariirhabdus haliotis]MCL6420710.1 DedA family protein [Aestuariirhabdus haliotis]